MTTTFYDAADAANIPDGADACVYVDGDFAISAAERKRLGKTRGITVLGGVAAALEAGCADAEQGNPVFDPARLRDWALGRRGMNCRARLYTDRANLQRNWDAVKDLDNVVLWVSTLELDAGRQWTVEELAADIAATERITLPLPRIWAVQFQGGMTAKVDVSLLLSGPW